MRTVSPLLAFSAVLGAQPPASTKVTVQYNPPTAEGQQATMEIKNWHTAPLIHFVAQGYCPEARTEYPGPHLPVRLEDLPVPPGIKLPPRPPGSYNIALLAPGESRIFPMPLRCLSGPLSRVAISGALFADATADGEPRALEYAQLQSRAEAAALQQWTPRFAALRQAEDANAAAQQLYQQLTDAVYALERDIQKLRDPQVMARQFALRRLQSDSRMLVGRQNMSRPPSNWDWPITLVEQRLQQMRPFLTAP